MKSKLLFCIILLLSVWSCSNPQIYDFVRVKYKNCGKTTPCVIDFNTDLNELIKEDWDTIYIIQGEFPSRLYSFKGGDFLSFSEAIPKILFTKGKNIIYQESFEPMIGERRTGLLLEYNLNPYTVISRKNAQFFIVPMSKNEPHYTKEALYIKYKK